VAVVCVRLVLVAVVTVIAIICRPVGVGGERGKGGVWMVVVEVWVLSLI
jgi:hypothetical protein